MSALSVVGAGVICFGGVVTFVGSVAFFANDERRAWPLLTCGYVLVALGAAARADWLAAGWFLLLAAAAAFWWWRNGGGRWRRAARELGAKSKARVEALVERMTRSPIPSPAGAM